MRRGLRVGRAQDGGGTELVLRAGWAWGGAGMETGMGLGPGAALMGAELMCAELMCAELMGAELMCVVLMQSSWMLCSWVLCSWVLCSWVLCSCRAHGC